MTIASKIAQASKNVGGKLRADKRNEQQNYGYISADKILSVCGQALAEEGIAVIPAIMDVQDAVVEYESYGKKKNRIDTRVHFLMKISDGENEIDLMWIGMGSDYSTPDKALYKAITSGHKYFLMKLLNVGEGNEDGEHEIQESTSKVQRKSANDNKYNSDADFDNLPTHPRSAHHKSQPIMLDGIEFPTGFDTGKAIAWAMKKIMPDGNSVFTHGNHAKNSLLKLRLENPDADMPTLKRAWKNKVEDKQTPDFPPSSTDNAQLAAELDEQAAAEEVADKPKF